MLKGQLSSRGTDVNDPLGRGGLFHSFLRNWGVSAEEWLCRTDAAKTCTACI